MTYIFESTGDRGGRFTLTIPKEAVASGMQHAAHTLAQDSKIPGFRPGNADYATIVSRYGEMKLLDLAAEDLIRTAFTEALEKEGIRTVGQPHFHAEKLAPDNDLVVTAEVTLYPRAVSLADPTQCTITPQSTEPSEDEVEKSLRSLADMQATEEPAPQDHVAQMGDKLIIDLTLKQNGVIVEGGHTQEMTVHTDESFYIPGFVDAVLGAKEGEERTFPLTFPKDYHATHLAGKSTDFEVKVKYIFLRKRPDIDDSFAKKLGLESKESLIAKLKENLEAERKGEELRRQDTEILNLLTEKSKFDDIPDLLVNQEIERMVHELQYNVEQSGGVFEDYLKQLNKSLSDLKLDFTPTAIKRIQASLYIDTYANQHHVTVSEESLAEFMDQARAQYGDRAEEYINNPHYKAFAHERLLHNTVLTALREIMVK